MSEVDKQRELRLYFQGSLKSYARHINPNYMYGEVHDEVFDALERGENLDNLLFLLPRGHLKSHCIAVWVSWLITKTPWTSILYVSANDDLVKVQMAAIQSMLTCPQYRKLWPDMVNAQESKREKWNEWAISVDHPLRKKMGTRDWTLAMRTIKSSSVGLHCDVLVFDDIVTDKNAYTAVGRKETENGVASFVGIKSPGAVTRAVGTRYHPQDVYGKWEEAKTPILDDDGNITGEEKQWNIVQGVVEDSGTGNGEFLWPRTQSPKTGLWYGFDARVLAKKKAEYVSLGHLAQFSSQYYNEPNDPGSDRVQSEGFLYYNRSLLVNIAGRWFYDGKRLNVSAGMDVAFTDDIGTRSDYSALAVIGADWEGYIYILALTMYKTDNYRVHYDKIMELYNVWKWSKIKIETNNGGKLIDKEIKKLLRGDGKTMRILSVAKTKHDGTKLERYALTLEPRYDQGMIYHPQGGFTPEYEEQVKKSRPRNDDLKDAVTSALEEIELPSRPSLGTSLNSNQVYSPSERFGGRRRRR